MPFKEGERAHTENKKDVTEVRNMIEKNSIGGLKDKVEELYQKVKQKDKKVESMKDEKN